ncbi:MAG: VOC family protein [Myxococcales bacterium]|nr:VOC family protein [Myxococcales bacterium]MCB9546185.1 VOC family protein [Myxococcales bacterium]
MKLHVALTTGRFDDALAFYTAFFGVEPVKRKPGYAKFDLDEPAVNFTLNAGEAQPAGRLNHLGIQVGDAEAVRAAASRLAALGFATRLEEGVDCCYALQDKVWVQDPDGNPWEVFVVHVADTAPALAPTATAPCCTPATAGQPGCCP